MQEYDHKKIEEKWKKAWQEDKTFKTPDKVEGKDNFYTLVEFPYPSGDLHVGHWYAFAISDIYAKYQRLTGKNVLFPIGFDAFGLPAENAAIKRNLDPKEWTYQNMDTMKKQMLSMGNSFDWDRIVRTTDPEYYKWTQWIFTQMFERGLAYKKKATVNWDPVDKTVLANEQVMPDGTAERSGAIVEKKEIDQWFLKITDYAERLYDDLDGLDWPNEIKEQQKNWIGKSVGAEIEFTIKDSESLDLDQKMKVFTTRPDTLFGATYVVLAPESNLVKELISAGKISNASEVEKYITEARAKSEIERTKVEKEKTGIKLEGVFSINPATKEEIPIFVADYVLASYGTGSVMAVPAHDERDYAFAKKFDLPIKHVICPHRVDPVNSPQKDKETVERKNIHVLLIDKKENKVACLHWKEHDWKTLIVGGVEGDEDDITAAKREVYEETGYKNLKYVKHLNPIPVIAEYYAAHKNHNKKVATHGLVFELENHDRDEISEEENAKHEINWYDFDRETIEKTINPCAELDIWLKGLDDDHCYPEEGVLFNSGNFDGLSSQEAKEKITEFVGGEIKTTFKLRDWSVGRQRYWGTPVPIVYDPDGKPHSIPKEHLPWTLPEDVDHTPTGEPPLAKSKELKERTEKIFGEGWTPEVETLDTFIDSSWYFLRYTDPNNQDEIADPEKLKSWMPIDFYSGGAEHTTLHLLYSRFFNKFLFDIKVAPSSEPYKDRLNRSLILGPDGNKMSKSKGNVINPDEIVENLGADTVRLYLAFIGPYNESGYYPWDKNGVVGVRRFLEKVWKISQKDFSETSTEKVKLELNRLIKKAHQDYPELKFNTVVAAMMSFINVVDKEGLTEEDFKKFLIIMSPAAPFISEELFKIKIKSEESVFDQKLPEFDDNILKTEEKRIGIQVNGKVRAEISVSEDDTEEMIKKRVLEMPEINKWTEDKKVSKFIYIPNKIISIVIN